MALPYWTTSEHAVEARWKLAGVVGLTLATTGVSVMFNFLGRVRGRAVHCSCARCFRGWCNAGMRRYCMSFAQSHARAQRLSPLQLPERDGRAPLLRRRRRAASSL